MILEGVIDWYGVYPNFEPMSLEKGTRSLHPYVKKQVKKMAE